MKREKQASLAPGKLVPRNKESQMKKAAGYFLFMMLVVSLLVSGCYQAPTSAPPPPQEMPTPTDGTIPRQVTIKDIAFSPREITIKVGETVTWTQQDSLHHTTTGNIWNSGDLGRGQTYSKTFDKTGNYDYRCNYHSYMKGKVIVE